MLFNNDDNKFNDDDDEDLDFKSVLFLNVVHILQPYGTLIHCK